MKPAVKWTLIAGIVCTLGAPLFGILFTVIGMVGAFHTLGHNGISDPAILSGYIGNALVATEIGIAIGILGLPIILVAVILHFATRKSPSPGVIASSGLR